MRIKGYLLAGIILQLFSIGLVHAELRTTYNDLDFIFSGVFKPETFYGKNINWLNNANDFDKAYYSRHVLDLTFDVLYGSQTYGSKILEFLFQLRNKGVWGNPESIASTTFADIKILNAIRGTHKHGFPRHIFWIRQLWLQCNLNQAANLPFKIRIHSPLDRFPSSWVVVLLWVMLMLLALKFLGSGLIVLWTNMHLALSSQVIFFKIFYLMIYTPPSCRIIVLV